MRMNIFAMIYVTTYPYLKSVMGLNAVLFNRQTVVVGLAFQWRQSGGGKVWDLEVPLRFFLPWLF